MFCTNCGAKIADGAKFCSNCGAKVPQQEESVPTPIRSSVVDSATANSPYVASSQPDEIAQTAASQIFSSEVTDQGAELSPQQENYQAKEKNIVQKFEDKITDTVGSALGGNKVETIRISKEDMIDLLIRHYIDLAQTEQEYETIQKTVNGSYLGLRQLDSKDGNYHISVCVGATINVLNPNECNWIRVTERSSGKIYQYSSLKWGDFKKTVKSVIDSANH